LALHRSNKLSQKDKTEGEVKKAHHRVQANMRFVGSPNLFWTMMLVRGTSRKPVTGHGDKCLKTPLGTSVLMDFLACASVLRLPDSADHSKSC